MHRRLPRASRVLLFLSLVVGAAAMLLLRGHLARLEARAAAGGPGVPTVVAAAALDRGTVLSPSKLEVVPVPERYRPPGSLGAVTAAAGRLLASSVAAGEPVTSLRLAPPGGPLAALVPEGLRAVPVVAPVPEGALAPGDRVDVLATFAAGQPHTETVLTSAEVLAILRASGPEAAGTPTLVLLVSPEDAERLAYARTFADLSIAIAAPAEIGP